MRLFYAALEEKLKRFQPIDYSPFVAEQLEQVRLGNRRRAQLPPHFLMHSIEANCAYTRGQNRDPVTWNRFGRVINVYNDFPDPLQTVTIPENLDRFFLLLDRQQMQLQRTYSCSDMARLWQLFVADDPLPKATADFFRKYRINPMEWLQLSFLTCTAAQQKPQSMFAKTSVSNYEHVNISDDSVDAFFELASKTPQEIGERYKRVRRELKFPFHSLIRSVFLETPLIKFGDDSFYTPDFNLVLHHAGEGLYRAFSELPRFGAEFGERFQRYVRKVLDCCEPLRLLVDSEIETLTARKSCDFLMETSDAIVLVECKAVAYTANMYSDEAIMNNNSTGKVAKALAQLYTTADDVAAGVFDRYDVDRRKPVVGIAVTFGEIPLANSEWYFNSFFLKRAAKQLKPAIYPSSAMPRRPFVISVGTLELLLMTTKTVGKTILELNDAKQTENYILVGDWDTFLNSKLSDSEREVKPLDFLETQIDNFLQTMTPAGALEDA